MARKRMKLPNGFGQISKITGRRLRNPYRAMVSVAPKKAKIVGYYKTYNDAYKALVEYHENPYDLSNDMTMSDLYEQWRKYKEPDVSVSTKRHYQNSWKHCSGIANIRVRDLRTIDIINALNQEQIPPAATLQVRSMLCTMLNYAILNNIVQINAAKLMPIPKINRTHHIAFSDEELENLRKHTEDQIYRLAYIQCYSGWRPQELLSLKKENINLEEGWMRGGMKTKAGIDRVVPIHPRIYDLVKQQIEGSTSDYLADMSYTTYHHKFVKYCPGHKPHDGRKHFVTMCKKYEVNDYAIKRMVGHTITDITENIYTERSVDWLKDELNKIP